MRVNRLGARGGAVLRSAAVILTRATGSGKTAGEGDNVNVFQENPMKLPGLYAFVLGCAVALTSGAMAAEAAKGKRVFNKCKACHSLQAGKKRVGPDLAKLFGRKAGTVKGYRYSKAMKKSGITWDEKTLDEYLTKPRKMVKGTKMAFPGLKKKADRDNLIVFLKEATK